MLKIYKNNSIKSKNEKTSVLFISCLMISTYLFANTVFISSLPNIRDYFKVSDQIIKNVVILYTFSQGISQIFYGPFSDYYDKRKIALLGTFILILGGVIVLLSPSIKWMLFGRILQGIGAGCYSVISKSITSNVYKDKSYINATSIIMIVSIMTEMLSPVIGSYLNTFFSWHANFVIIIFYSVVTFFILFLFFPEVKLIPPPNSFNCLIFFQNYQKIFKKRNFFTLLLMSAFTLSAIMSYQIMSPFILVDIMSLSIIHYGWASLLTSSGFLLGNCILPWLNGIFSTRKNILLGLIIMFMSIFLMIFLAYLKYQNPIVIIMSMFFYNIGAGIIFLLTMGEAILIYPSIIGSAAAMIGSIQMFVVTIVSSLTTYINIQNQYDLALALLILTTICFLLFFYTFFVYKVRGIS